MGMMSWLTDPSVSKCVQKDSEGDLCLLHFWNAKADGETHIVEHDPEYIARKFAQHQAEKQEEEKKDKDVPTDVESRPVQAA